MLCFLVTVILTSAAWAGLLWFMLRRVVQHLRSNPDGVKAISEHIFIPMFKRKVEPAATEPAPQADDPAETRS
jgi:hypothetical protein